MANARDALLNLHGYQSNSGFLGNKLMTLFSSAALVSSGYTLMKSGGLSYFYDGLMKSGLKSLIEDKTLSSIALQGFSMIAAMILLITNREENHGAKPLAKLLRDSIRNGEGDKQHQFNLFSSAKAARQRHDDLAFAVIMTVMLTYLENELIQHSQSFSYLEMMVFGALLVAFQRVYHHLQREPEFKVTI